MKTGRYIFLAVSIIVLSTAVANAQNINIAQLDFALSVEDRQPVGIDTVFAPDVGNVFCFTNIRGVEDTADVYHVWYYKDEEKARIKLPVRSNNWRTWSSKSILESWTGGWRVIIEDGSGNILANKSFVVEGADER